MWIANLGIALGAGLYEARIVFPQWLSRSSTGFDWNAEAAREANTGLRFWAFVSTVPLTALTLGNLLAALRAPVGLRGRWLATTGVGLVERAFTFAYFIPTMLHLMSGESSADRAVSLAQQWDSLNELRHGLLVVAWIGAMSTFAAFHARPRALAGLATAGRPQASSAAAQPSASGTRD